jgi:diaminopimelate epimerase
MSYEFLKGHGTENDFVLLPDLDGTVHGELTEARVRALCDRRAGIGGDGVLRVVRRDGGWFMDYRNADGSVSEMCGNGIRLFARYLVEEGLVDGAAPIPVDTRDGVKVLTLDGDLITVDMGTPKVLGDTTVGVDTVTWAARHVDTGTPHAVAFVSSLAEVGPLLEPPRHDPAVYPDGVNVEFVVRRSERHIAMRVHERGSGETRSCGTGACAAMVAAAVAADDRPAGSDVVYRVDVPGGTLTVTWTADDRVLLTGPAVIVARGTTDL